MGNYEKENKSRSNRIFYIKQRILMVDIIIENMSKDLEGMIIENNEEYSIENSIAKIFINESLGIVNIEIKDPEALEIDEEDLFEEYSKEVTYRKWWMFKSKTRNENFVRPILNNEDMKEILLRLTEVYNEYEYNRLTSIMNKFNIDIDDINYLKQYFRR